MKKEEVVVDNRKYYELNEEERKEYRAKMWKKAKPIVFRVIVAAFCIILCLFMVFSLIAPIFTSKKTDSSEEATQAFILLKNLL